MIEKSTSQGRTKVSKKDEKELFDRLTKEKSIKGMTWGDVASKLSIEQKNGTLLCSIDLTTISEQSLSSKYSRMKKKYI